MMRSIREAVLFPVHRNVRVAAIRDDVGIHIIVSGADATDELPVAPLVIRSEDVAIRRAQKKLVDFVGVRRQKG
jgi:glutamine phosphoribosylpyrophosphate amidotransferase